MLKKGHDDECLYVALDVIDDNFRRTDNPGTWRQDGVEIRVDARPEPERSESVGENDYKAHVTVLMSPS